MSIQITIIGLGQIGASVGMALGEHGEKFTRTGHDIDSGYANAAKKAGALDKVAFNLPSAVAEADIVLLAVPMDAVQGLLEMIAPDLQEGAVVMDVSPIRQVTSAWAKEMLPARRYYVGITPMISPLFLEQVAGGLAAADAKLFDHGLFAITAPSGTVPQAMKLATDLVEMMGATPLFADMMEIDSYMAAVHVMPQLMASALVSTTVGQPGWQEGRKFAGRSYSVAASPAYNQDLPEALADASFLNRENTVRVLDGLIAELQSIREQIEGEDRDGFTQRLKEARESFKQWLSERGAANWAGEGMPEVDIDAGRRNLFGRFGEARKTEDEE